MTETIVSIAVVLLIVGTFGRLFFTLHKFDRIKKPEGNWRIVAMPDSFVLQSRSDLVGPFGRVYSTYMNRQSFNTEAEALEYYGKVHKAETTPPVYLP